AFITGFAAALIGLGLGIAFSSVIGSLFEAIGIDLPNTGTVIETRTIIVSLILGTGLTLLAALLPALRATRVPPVSGLRDGAVPATPSERRQRNAAAVILTAGALAMMLLGVFEVLSPGITWVGLGAAPTLLGVALLSPQL